MAKSALLCTLLCLGLVAGCDDKPSAPAPAAPRQPSLDEVIRVSVRQSRLNSSTAVLQLTNKSAGPIDKVGMSFENLDSKQKKHYEIETIRAGECKEVGILEAGWKFVPNEEIFIYTEGSKYSSVTYKTYRAQDGSVGIKVKGWW